MSCLQGGKGDMKVLCHIEVTQTCHWCCLWWPLTWGMCCREAQLVWGLYFLPLIITSLWHVTATGITLWKQKSCKAEPAKSKDKCSRKPTQEGLVYNPSTSVQCRQVALKMNSDGRAGRAGRNAQRQWHQPSWPIIAKLLKRSFFTYAGLLQMGQPAGPKTVSSTMCLDLFSDVATARSDVIFLSTYTDLSISSVVSSPGPRVPLPGSLRKDRDMFGSWGHVFH